MNLQEYNHEEEELECLHMFLDSNSIPRQDIEGKTYSIVGRVKQLQKKYLTELSELETYYLNNKKS